MRAPRKRATRAAQPALRAQTPALRDVPDIRDLLSMPTLAPCLAASRRPRTR